MKALMAITCLATTCSTSAACPAGPGEPSGPAVARQWAKTFGRLIAGRVDAQARALAVHRAKGADATKVKVDEFARMLHAEAGSARGAKARIDGAIRELGLRPASLLTRADACRIVYRASAKG